MRNRESEEEKEKKSYREGGEKAKVKWKSEKERGKKVIPI